MSFEKQNKMKTKNTRPLTSQLASVPHETCHSNLPGFSPVTCFLIFLQSLAFPPWFFSLSTQYPVSSHHIHARAFLSCRERLTTSKSLNPKVRSHTSGPLLGGQVRLICPLECAPPPVSANLMDGTAIPRASNLHLSLAACPGPSILSVDAPEADVCGFGWHPSFRLPLSTTLTFSCGKLSLPCMQPCWDCRTLPGPGILREMTQGLTNGEVDLLQQCFKEITLHLFLLRYLLSLPQLLLFLGLAVRLSFCNLNSPYPSNKSFFFFLK